MANIIVCDLCEDKTPLDASSTSITMRKYSKRTAESEDYVDYEWDLCPKCFAKVKALGFEFEGES